MAITNKTLNLENGTATHFEVQAIQANYNTGTGWIELKAFADMSKVEPLKIISIQFTLGENPELSAAVVAFSEAVASAYIDAQNV